MEVSTRMNLVQKQKKNKMGMAASSNNVMYSQIQQQQVQDDWDNFSPRQQAIQDK